MYFRNSLSTWAFGVCLAASNTLWLLDSQSLLANLLPLAIEEEENVNGYAPEESTVPSGVTFQADYDKESKTFQNQHPYLTSLTKPSKKYYLITTQVPLDDFSLHFGAKADDYSGVKVEEIKISLFSKPAWESTTNSDEYKLPLAEDKVKELFRDRSELKVKQLLLSLSTKRRWRMKAGTNHTYETDYSISRPGRVEDLRNLEIKYFSTFETLKDYILKKSLSCTDPRRSCVAKEGELGIMDQDRSSFFRIN